MKIYYGLMCFAGALLPLAQFVPWLAEHGLALPLLLQSAFGSPISAFAWFDVLVSGLVLLPFMLVEGRRCGIPYLVLPVLALLVVGVSLALPLFLLMRELRLGVVSDAAGGTSRPMREG
jgi:hypothetical protein